MRDLCAFSLDLGLHVRPRLRSQALREAWPHIFLDPLFGCRPSAAQNGEQGRFEHRREAVRKAAGEVIVIPVSHLSVVER
jgi:hypothetical protein